MQQILKNNIDALVEIKTTLKVLEEKNKASDIGGIPSLDRQQHFLEIQTKIDHIKSLLAFEAQNISDIYKPLNEGYRPPTKEEVREEFTGFPGSRLAKILGVNPRTVRKWIGGESEVTYSAWRLFLIKRGKVFEDLI